MDGTTAENQAGTEALSLGQCPNCGCEGEFEMDDWSRIGRCEPCKVRWSIGEDAFLVRSTFQDETDHFPRRLNSSGYALVELFADPQTAIATLHECEIRYREAYLVVASAIAAVAKTRDSISDNWAAARAYLAIRRHYVEQRPAWMLDDRDCMVW